MMEISLKAEHLFNIGLLPVTNSVLYGFMAVIFLGITGFFFRKKIKLVPGQFQNFIEFAVEGFLLVIEPILGSRTKAEKYLPLIATIFFFIMISNWLILLPGVGSVGLWLSEHEQEVFVPCGVRPGPYFPNR